MGKPEKLRNEEALEKAPVGRLLFKMSVHTGLSLIIYSLLSLTDTIIVSWGVDPIAAGAISVSSPLLLFLSAVSTIAGAGGASVVSRALGAGDRERAATAAGNVFLAFWTTAVAVTVIGLIFLEPLLTLMGATGELMPYASDYSRVLLIGAVTSTGFSSLVRAEGASRFSLMLWVIPISVNMLLDPIFVFALDMGVTGAALGTLISQGVSVCMSMWFFFIKKGRPYKISKRHFVFRAAILKEVAAVGLPSFFQMLFLAATLAVTNRILAHWGGETAVTAMGFAVKLQMLLILPQNGIVQAMQPIIGYNYAKGARERVKKSLIGGAAGVFLTGLALTLPAVFCGEWLMMLFTSRAEIISAGSEMLVWLSAALAVKGGVTYCFSAYQAVGKKALAAAVTLLIFFAVQLPLLLSLGLTLGVNGVCIAMPCIDVIGCALALVTLKIKPVYPEVDNEKQNQKQT